MKSLKRIITLLSILLFVLSGCSFNQKFNISKTGKITIVIGSACRSADIDQLIKQKNAFLKIKIHGALEDSKIVKFERGASISFNNIPIDSEVYLEGYIFTEEISEDGESIKNVILYKGKSETVVIEPGDNKISLKLKSVANDDSVIEISTGSDDNGQSETNTDTGNQNGNTGGSSGNTGGNTGGSETGGTEHPATGKIEIYMNAEDQIFAEGSEIIFTAQDAEGNAIAAENISVEFNVRYFYNNQWDVYTFSSKIDDPDDGEYEIVKNGNEVIITTQITVLPPDQCFYYFTATITDGSNQENKTFDEFELIPGQKTETKFFASYNKDEVYANGSTIVFSAKDKDNNPIPADKLIIEFFSDRTGYSNPSPIDYYTIERAQYNAFVTTAILGGDMAEYSDPTENYYLYFVVTNTLNGESRQFIIDFIYGTKPDTIFVMNPSDGKILPLGTITVTAFDKNYTPIIGEDISLTSDGIQSKMIIGNKPQIVTIPSTYYDPDNHGDFTIQLNDPRANTTDPFPDDYFNFSSQYYFTLKVTKGELEPDFKTFYFSLKAPEVSETIDITNKTQAQIASEIQTAMTDIVTYQAGTLELIFTGENNNDGINLYSSVMDVICAENTGVSKNANGVKLILDYSNCSGSTLSIIPENTYKENTILKSIKLSESTVEIESYAFCSNTSSTNKIIVTLDELDLLNVTKIGPQSFLGSQIKGDFKMPKVTEFGNDSCDGLTVGKVILGAAEEIYNENSFSEYGLYVFKDATIGTLVANKLKRIENSTFSGANIGSFIIPDTLVFVGSRSLAVNSNSNVYFASESSKINWYAISAWITVDGVDLKSKDICRGLYNGTYTVSQIQENCIPGSDYFELVDPDDLLDLMFDYDLQYYFIRINN